MEVKEKKPKWNAPAHLRERRGLKGLFRASQTDTNFRDTKRRHLS